MIAIAIEFAIESAIVTVIVIAIVIVVAMATDGSSVRSYSRLGIDLQLRHRVAVHPNAIAIVVMAIWNVALDVAVYVNVNVNNWSSMLMFPWALVSQYYMWGVWPLSLLPVMIPADSDDCTSKRTREA